MAEKRAIFSDSLFSSLLANICPFSLYSLPVLAGCCLSPVARIDRFFRLHTQRQIHHARQLEHPYIRRYLLSSGHKLLLFLYRLFDLFLIIYYCIWYYFRESNNKFEGKNWLQVVPSADDRVTPAPRWISP